MAKTLAIIPARLESSRLPGKVLLKLGGKPMIQRVFELCQQVQAVDQVFVATDNSKIQHTCLQFTNNIVLTKKNHLSGTDRIAEAVEKLDAEFIINVQADEPFLEPSLIHDLVQSIQKKTCPMVSAMHVLEDEQEIEDPSNVKVVCNQQQYALYFSRAPIPKKPSAGQAWLVYKHIGVYAYQKEFLLRYASWLPTDLEQTEKLEQLRVLEHGYKIQMLLCDTAPLNIDTLKDFKQAERKFKNGK